MKFKNKTIANILETFDITRSLSAKGNPYDNAVSEAGMKVIKTEFVYQEKFDSLEVLEMKLFDYINWYNNIRIQGSLNYMTPVSYRKQMSL
jgi:transposase InsO family protein